MASGDRQGAREDARPTCLACAGTGWTGVEWLDRSRGEIRYDRELCVSCGGGGGAEHYPDRTTSPIRYFAVSRLAGIVGYLWAAEHNDAAGFLHKPYGPDQYPFPGYRLWRARLSQGKATGLEPLDFLEQWRKRPRHPRAGGVPDGAEASFADSLHDLERIARQPENYRTYSESPVRYLPVTLHDRVIGYLWASTAAGAADFMARAGTGSTGIQAGVWWRSRLQEAYAAGFHPDAAIHALAGGPEVPMAGRVPADATEQEAASSQDLRAIAYRTHE